MRSFRSAFTMIELLFVIVILGLVGGFAVEAIRQYYEGIFKAQVYTQRVNDADHVLLQLSKYFENAVSLSIVNLDAGSIGEGTCKEIGSATGNYTVAFVAVDFDHFQGYWNGTQWAPGWSSDVTYSVNNIIAFDGNYTAVLGGVIDNNITVYDQDSNSTSNTSGRCNDFKWVSSTTTTYNPITALVNDHTITVTNKLMNGKNKYLLNSGYAFRVNSNGDFVMYSNFRPWKGERYNTATNRHENILAQNVANFQIINNGTHLKTLKLCMRGIDTNLSSSENAANDICRQKVVHVRY